MKNVVVIAAAVASILVLGPTYAQDPHGHDTDVVSPASKPSGGGPGQVAGEARGASPRATPGKSFDEHMQQMRAAHDRMLAAKTPEARRKAMADARKAMQDSMADMQVMMGRDGMMGHREPAQSQDERMEGMEQRLDMMQMMMQMMMDQQGIRRGSP